MAGDSACTTWANESAGDALNRGANEQAVAARRLLFGNSGL